MQPETPAPLPMFQDVRLTAVVARTASWAGDVKLPNGTAVRLEGKATQPGRATCSAACVGHAPDGDRGDAHLLGDDAGGLSAQFRRSGGACAGGLAAAGSRERR